MRWQFINDTYHGEPAKWGKGSLSFSPDNLIFKDHFPGFPLLPGVLQIEMMAQIGGRCIALANSQVLPILGKVDRAKFYHHVLPGEICDIEAQILKMGRNYATAKGIVMVNSKKVASADLLYGFIDLDKIKNGSA